MKTYTQKIEMDPVLARSRYGIGDALMMECTKPCNIPAELAIELRATELYQHIQAGIEASSDHVDSASPHKAP